MQQHLLHLGVVDQRAAGGPAVGSSYRRWHAPFRCHRHTLGAWMRALRECEDREPGDQVLEHIAYPLRSTVACAIARGLPREMRVPPHRAGSPRVGSDDVGQNGADQRRALSDELPCFRPGFAPQARTAQPQRTVVPRSPTIPISQPLKTSPQTRQRSFSERFVHRCAVSTRRKTRRRCSADSSRSAAGSITAACSPNWRRLDRRSPC